MLYTCFYCTKTSQSFNDIISHLVENHSNKEIKFRHICGSKLKTIYFKIIPDLCREQGRTITVNNDTQTIHVSRCGENPKESPVKKIERVEKNVKPTELNTETDPLVTEEDCSTDDTVLQELTLILYISHFHL